MLRINGIVRLSNTVRSRLSGPISDADLASLRRHVEHDLASIGRTLAAHRATEASLPTPSRRAMAFLKSVDWSRVQAGAPNNSRGKASRRFGWKGLTRHFESILQDLWTAGAEAAVDEAHGVISCLSRHIESGIQRHGEDNIELSDGTAGIRGWLGFFSGRDNLEKYLTAMQRARVALSATLERHWPRRRLMICFRPIEAIYQVKATSQACPLSLPTPMITFSAEDFAWLGKLIGRRDSEVRQVVVKAMERDDYQAIRQELDRLGGLRSHPGGVHHSLETVFARVNERFFRGLMPRPRLVWSAVITARKFGHYDQLHDTLLISATVDRADVPEFVIDFLMYHELLHKEMGVDRSGGRAYAHTPEFRAAERRFPQYREAEATLLKLAMAG